MQIFPDHARRSIYGLRAPRVATVGRLGALGADQGVINFEEVTLTADRNGYYVSDGARQVYVGKDAVDAGLAAGGVPRGVAPDGIIWSTTDSQNAYVASITGYDISRPSTLPPSFLSATAANEWASRLRGSLRTPGVTPAEDIALSTPAASTARKPTAAEMKRAEELAARAKNEKGLLEKITKCLEPGKKTAAQNAECAAYGLVGAGGAWLLKLALKKLIQSDIEDGKPIPKPCASFMVSNSDTDALACAACKACDCCPTAPPGAIGADPCSVAGIAATTVSINLATDAKTVDQLVKGVEASCGANSPAADLIRKTGEDRKKQLATKSALLWGGLGLAAVLLIAASRRK